MPNTEQLGLLGLTGWREKVADVVAPPVASKAPLSEDQARAIVGGAFFVLSVYYVVTTVAKMIRAARD
jgi:hypothetical protein